MMLNRSDESDDTTIIPFSMKNVKKFEQYQSIYTDLLSSRTETDINDINASDTYNVIRK